MKVTFDLLENDKVRQARSEMVAGGYEELLTADDVDAAFARKGTTLVMVNSKCGCTGGVARPAAVNAIHYDKRPDYLVTVFAGEDNAATDHARSYFEGYPPSSPSFTLLKDGKVCAMLPREEIQGYNPIQVIEKLQAEFEKYCDEI